MHDSSRMRKRHDAMQVTPECKPNEIKNYMARMETWKRIVSAHLSRVESNVWHYIHQYFVAAHLNNIHLGVALSLSRVSVRDLWLCNLSDAYTNHTTHPIDNTLRISSFSSSPMWVWWPMFRHRSTAQIWNNTRAHNFKWDENRHHHRGTRPHLLSYFPMRETGKKWVGKLLFQLWWE